MLRLRLRHQAQATRLQVQVRVQVQVSPRRWSAGPTSLGEANSQALSKWGMRRAEA